MCEGLFLGSNFVPLVYVSIFMPIPHCFDYQSFSISFEMRQYEISNFVLLFQDYFGYSGSLEISYKFWNVLFYF